MACVPSQAISHKLFDCMWARVFCVTLHVDLLASLLM